MATSFFVSVPTEGWNHIVTYAVTARHNLEYVHKERPLYLRFNTSSQVHRDLEMDVESWVPHSKLDIAAARVEIPLDMMAACVPLDMLSSSIDMMKKFPPSPGDRVVISTLFEKLQGKYKIQPIPRFGNLCLIPDELLDITTGPMSFGEMEGYLIESLSFGGSSGAPVFLCGSDPLKKSTNFYGSMRLLGVMQGHYDSPRPVKFAVDEQEHEISIPNNAGIAIVMPAHGILDLIMTEEELEVRKEIRRKLDATKGNLY